MAKLKFGKRLKVPFRVQKPSSAGSRSDDHAGPMEVGTKKNGMSKQKDKQKKGAKSNGERRLPRIVEAIDEAAEESRDESSSARYAATRTSSTQSTAIDDSGRDVVVSRIHVHESPSSPVAHVDRSRKDGKPLIPACKATATSSIAEQNQHGNRMIMPKRNFMSTSKYAAEIDPVESHETGMDTDDRYASIDQPPMLLPSPTNDSAYPTLSPTGDRYAIAVVPRQSLDKKPSTPTAQAPKASKTQSSNGDAAPPPPKTERLTPTKMFQDAIKSFRSKTWDPLSYTSLEDALVDKFNDAVSSFKCTTLQHTHTSLDDALTTKNSTMLATNEQQRGTTVADNGYGEAIAAAAKSISPMNKSSAKAGSVEAAASVATSAGPSPSPSRKKEVIKEVASLIKASNPEFMAMKKNTEKDEFKKLHNHLGQIDGEVQATKTCLASPAPPSTTADAKAEQPLEAILTQLSPDVFEGVDVKQSLSFDEENSDLQRSLSDDSNSYLSELESIGDITICEETERLLEAHKLYTNDAVTNVHHPSRRKKSIMRVGSIFRQGISGGSTSKDGWLNLPPATDSKSIRTDYSPLSIRTEVYREKKNITWYDDDENWEKVFVLRTDETFDFSSVTGTTATEAHVIRFKVVEQVVGGLIDGFAQCAGGEGLQGEEEGEI